MIDVIKEEGKQKRVFGPTEEKAIISLAFDVPDLFANIGKHLSPEYFEDFPTKYIYSIIYNYLTKNDVILTRGMCRDKVLKELTADDRHQEILETIDKKSDPRDLPIVKDTLIQWARHKAYNQIYSEDAISAYEEGEYDKLEEIIEEAKKITDIQSKGLWFFEQLDILFQEDTEEKLVTGFTRLDAMLNEGGPTRKEVLCYIAPTGVGKCHTLQSKIIERKLSRIYELETEDGKTIKLAGFREIQTKRGKVRVCDLSEGDDITQIPAQKDAGDLSLSDM